MKFAVVRLVLATALFLGWIGWLGYLALTTTRPVILSRPQFLVSTLDVIAEVVSEDDLPSSRATIQKIHWPPEGQESLIGKTIPISNLPHCKGWEGPGSYILPLEKKGTTYQVADIPSSPGFNDPNDARIYRLDPRTAKQLEAIPK